MTSRVSSRDLNLAPDYTLRFFSHLLSAFLPFHHDNIIGLTEYHELAKSASDLAMNDLTVRNVKILPPKRIALTFE